MHLSKKSEEELKKLGVTEQESGAINALAQKVESGDLKAIKIAVDGRDKDLVDAVRTAGLLEQVKGGAKGAGFWTERVKEMGAVHAAIKKSSAENKDEGASDTRKGDREERDGDWSKRSSNKYRTDNAHDHKGSRDVDSWGDGKSDNGFSDRFDGPKGYSARDRVAKNRDASREEASDFRAV